MNEPEFDNWKDAWEYHATESHKQQVAMGEDALLDQLMRGITDGYFSSWSAIGDVGTVDKSAVPLFRFLMEVRMDYLNRYHCTDALAKILGMSPELEVFKGIKFDHEGEHIRQGFLKQLWAIITTRLSRPVQGYTPEFNEHPEAWIETKRYALTLRPDTELSMVTTAWENISKKLLEHQPEVRLEMLESPEGIDFRIGGLSLQAEVRNHVASQENGGWKLLSRTEFSLRMIRSVNMEEIFLDAIRRYLFDVYEVGYEAL